MISVRDVCGVFEKKFPHDCAESWDNPGLLLGRTAAPVSRVLTALELTPDVAKEAIQIGAQMIITHHPFIFKPFKSLTDNSADGQILLDLAEHHIALFAAHTNLDAAPNAIAQKLSADFNLQNPRPLSAHKPYDACKIIVFVPQSDAERVSDAMIDAGAGAIGNYAAVSFRSPGEGRFTPQNGANPAIGACDCPQTVPENKIEMIASSQNVSAVLSAIKRAHPYEEPAIDVFKLQNEIHGIDDRYGFGCIGDLPQTCTLGELIEKIKNVWKINSLRASGDVQTPISRLAILNGSGAKFLPLAKKLGADAYITGDCGHHDFDLSCRLQLPLIDAGHFDTEKSIVRILAETLRKDCHTQSLDIRESECVKNPFNVY